MTPDTIAREAIHKAAATTGWRDQHLICDTATAALKANGVKGAAKLVQVAWQRHFWTPGLDAKGIGG